MEKNVRISRRRWWLAGLLSYLVPGLGQVYNGQATKGLLFNFLMATWGGLVFSLVFFMLKHPPARIRIFLFFLLFGISLLLHLLIILEAMHTAGKKGKGYPLQPYNRVIIYLAALLVSLGVDYSVSKAVKEYVLKPFRIPSISMEPVLLSGDHLLSNQLHYADHNPSRGDVVIFLSHGQPGDYYIKRIIGLPGDTLEIRDKSVRINGKALDEPYVKHEDAQVIPAGAGIRDNLCPVVIRPDEYFVMGDNRDASLDSRHHGIVRRHQIKGKPMFVYFSWNEDLPKWKIWSRWASLRPGRIGKIIE
ncbi:signal peptidase I [bacterium]|nr:signal peptidase I [bacterium]